MSTDLATRDGGGRSNVDNLLIRHANKSPREVEELTGIPAGEAMTRLNELLDSRDHLTIRRQEVLIVEELMEVVHDAKERMRNAGDRDYAAIANVVIRSGSQLLTRLEAARKNTSIDVNKITDGQARVFYRIFDIMLGYILDELKGEYGIPIERVLNLHREATNVAQLWASENVIEDID